MPVPVSPVCCTTTGTRHQFTERAPTVNRLVFLWYTTSSAMGEGCLPNPTRHQPPAPRPPLEHRSRTRMFGMGLVAVARTEPAGVERALVAATGNSNAASKMSLPAAQPWKSVARRVCPRRPWRTPSAARGCAHLDENRASTQPTCRRVGFRPAIAAWCTPSYGSRNGVRAFDAPSLGGFGVTIQILGRGWQVATTMFVEIGAIGDNNRLARFPIQELPSLQRIVSHRPANQLG